MFNGIRTIYPHGLNKGFGLKFRVGSRIRQETHKEGRRMRWLKRFEYNNKGEDETLNTLNDKKCI